MSKPPSTDGESRKTTFCSREGAQTKIKARRFKRWVLLYPRLSALLLPASPCLSAGVTARAKLGPPTTSLEEEEKCSKLQKPAFSCVKTQIKRWVRLLCEGELGRNAEAAEQSYNRKPFNFSAGRLKLGTLSSLPPQNEAHNSSKLHNKCLSVHQQHLKAHRPVCGQM